MTQITASMVSDLRARTGVGMMECKKALVAANGDINEAIEALRKAGQAQAVKKGSRVAAEGLITASLSSDNKTASIAEVNCETDFVARGDSFKNFSKEVASAILAGKETMANGQSFEQARLELVAQVGENVSIRRSKVISAPANGSVGFYLHGANQEAGRIGALVVIDIENPSLARELAMHVAAMEPEYINEAAIPAERLTKEKEILLEQSKENNPGKPVEILEKIISGRIAKFVQEITLLGQPFVKDTDKTVSELLKENNANVLDMIRFEVGEGIEKKTSDFVSEVMSQVKG